MNEFHAQAKNILESESVAKCHHGIHLGSNCSCQYIESKYKTVSDLGLTPFSSVKISDSQTLVHNGESSGSCSQNHMPNELLYHGLNRGGPGDSSPGVLEFGESGGKIPLNLYSRSTAQRSTKESKFFYRKSLSERVEAVYKKVVGSDKELILAIEEECYFYCCEEYPHLRESDEQAFLQKFYNRVDFFVEKFFDYWRKIKDCSEDCGYTVCNSCTTRYNFQIFNSCSHRFCALCQHRQQKKWLHDKGLAVLKYAQKNPSLVPVHIVLTLKSNSGKSLANQINRLQSCFLQLRRRKIWKEHFTAAISNIECTFGEAGPHPHLHIVAFRRKFCPWIDLRQNWSEITGDSDVVFIKRAYDRNRQDNRNMFEAKDCGETRELVSALLECTKYIIKFDDIAKIEDHEFVRLVCSTYRKNLRDTLGELRGYEVLEWEKEKYLKILHPDVEQNEDACANCPCCGSFDAVQVRVFLEIDKFYIDFANVQKRE